MKHQSLSSVLMFPDALELISVTATQVNEAIRAEVRVPLPGAGGSFIKGMYLGYIHL